MRVFVDGTLIPEASKVVVEYSSEPDIDGNCDGVEGDVHLEIDPAGMEIVVFDDGREIQRTTVAAEEFEYVT